MILRSLLYAAIFYPATALLAVVGLAVGLVSRPAMLALILAWARLNDWLARNVLGIRTRVEGQMPKGPHLIAVKHQSMFETTEMMLFVNVPVIVIKRELALIPFVGWLMRRYGVIAVERSAGAKALRALVSQARKAGASGRPILIYPEGTRVRP
ncbi:MAG: lysophospholipid acyltransferase family protein, partial [Sphingomicrobium sp.]